MTPAVACQAGGAAGRFGEGIFLSMRAQTVDIRQSTGRILCCTIFRPGGKKLLAKGHVLSEEDVRLLEGEGLRQVWVTELEDGEVPEDAAVSQAAAEMG